MHCFCIVKVFHNTILRRTVAPVGLEDFSPMHCSFVTHRTFRKINTGYPEQQLLPGFGHVFIPGFINALQVFTTDQKITLTIPVPQQTIVSDFYEPGGQYMKQESADELRNLQSHYLVFISVRIITPHKGNPVTLHIDDPLISYGDTMSISAEIPENTFRAVERRLTVYNPLTAVHVLEELFECVMILQLTGSGQIIRVIALSEISEELAPEQS